jgi:U2-associated protein SR140
MFKGGSLWRPPRLHAYTQGMPEELVNVSANSSSNGGGYDGDDAERKGQLSDSQRDRLEDILRDLTPERNKVGEAMVWCLDHATSSEEIVECITEALSILQTPLPKKVPGSPSESCSSLTSLFLDCPLVPGV